MVFYGHISGKPVALEIVKHYRWSPLHTAVAGNLVPLPEIVEKQSRATAHYLNKRVCVQLKKFLDRDGEDHRVLHLCSS